MTDGQTEIQRAFTENGLKRCFSFDLASIRLARKEDELSALELVNRAFSYHDKRRGRERMTATEFHKWRQEQAMFVVEMNREVTAIVNVWFDLRGRPHFSLLAVTKTQQGKGLAAAVLKALERQAKLAGFKEAALGVMDVAPHWLEGYYKKRGYQATGKIYEWNNINVVDMVKVL